jgi:hypothetical protein
VRFMSNFLKKEKHLLILHLIRCYVFSISMPCTVFISLRLIRYSRVLCPSRPQSPARCGRDSGSRTRSGKCGWPLTTSSKATCRSNWLILPAAYPAWVLAFVRYYCYSCYFRYSQLYEIVNPEQE